MREVSIGDRKVGDGHPCLIMMEAGATHTGLESAKQLAQAAADGGADAIKFQTVDTEKLMAVRDTEVEYTTAGATKKELVYDALKRRELTPDEWRELKRFSDELGLLFISTPSDEQTVDLLVDIGVHGIKVAKADVNHFYLVDYIARTGKPVFLDGRERYEDVERNVEICESHGVKDIVIMHCPSGYPTKDAGVHLSVIPHVKGLFGYPVGYADHSVGAVMNHAAVALGANVIEKTITLDRGTDAVEHYMSLEPGEVPEFVRSIRSVEQAMGNPRIIFNSRVEAVNRRSIFAARDIRAGEELSIEALAFRRPGIYLSAQHYEAVLGKRLNRDLQQGEPILERYLE